MIYTDTLIDISTFLSSGLGENAPEYNQINDVAESMKSTIRSALHQSGFAATINTSDGFSKLNFAPCPAGTFVNSSEKGYPGCKKCPPGNFNNLNKLIESHSI